MHIKHERLEEENANLRQAVQQLASKVEELDMEKKETQPSLFRYTKT